MTRPQLYTLAATFGLTAAWSVALFAWEMWAWWKWGGTATITSSLRALARSQPWLTHGLAALAGLVVGWCAGHVTDYGDEGRTDETP
jgi:hypothetical protein